jgi:predicted MFS family arabinose efflux permease
VLLTLYCTLLWVWLWLCNKPYIAVAVQDLTTRYTGILFGITNSASSLAGTASTFATGLVLDATHSWALVFETVALVYVASAAVYASWASASNQFDELPAPEPRSDGSWW